MASKIASLASDKLCFASQQGGLNGCSHAPAYKPTKPLKEQLSCCLHKCSSAAANNLPTDRFGNERDALLLDRSVRLRTHTSTPAAEASHAPTSGTTALPLREPIPFRPADE